MRIAHTALWTCDIEAAASFWTEYFGASVGEPYRSQRRAGFISRLVHLPGGIDQIELMTGPWISADAYRERAGWDHIAISLGDKAAVDALAARCRRDGCLQSGPRVTGDGFYEAVITMLDGTQIEITI
ncbi:MAG: glyoxalase/bleomycin resistance/extradiol dioxygenase family protein [Rhizobium sp.]|nr:MAG: glyoxalase/bleomycin resistance/extradiol dioxygenase family protein [Rhizobium sp.]